MNLVEKWSEHRPWQLKYGLAVAMVLLCLLGQWVLGLLSFTDSLLLFLPSIILSAWYGGVQAGIFATGMSGFLAVLLFLPLPKLFEQLSQQELISWTFFWAVGSYISALNSRNSFSTIPETIQSPRLQKCPLNASDVQLQHSLKELSDIKWALDQAAIVAITDARGVIQAVNDRFCEISQYSRAELVGNTHRLINSGFHSKEFFQTFWATISGGQVWQGEIQNRAKDGSIYWVDTTVVPILDDEGKIFQYLAIRFDVTQRKRAELALQHFNDQLEDLVAERTARLQQSLEFEATLKRITDKVRDSLDESQVLQTAVEELAQILGINACHASLYDLDIGTSTICYEFNPSIFAERGHITRMAEAPEIYQALLQGNYLQFCNLPHHPTRGRVSMLVCPLMVEQEVEGDLWLIIDKDYAFRELEIRLVQQVANQCAIGLRQAKLYQSAQTQVKMLEQVNWLKDDFLSTVSHELRTPVSNMKMSIYMLEMALQRYQDESGGLIKVNQYVQILKYECEREITLINDLLDLQRLEAGQRSLALETVQIQPWLTQILKPFENRVRDRQIRLRLTLPLQDLPPLVADLPALERILSELLNNACKYTPPAEEIVVSARTEPGIMQFSVRNTGTEIAPDELPKIFDKFYRVPNADPWRQGGTGLGLALVQRLVKHLSGNIQVRSELGQTEFIVEIPNQLVREGEGKIRNTT